MSISSRWLRHAPCKCSEKVRSMEVSLGDREKCVNMRTTDHWITSARFHAAR